jgi:hypothetical protein
VVDVAECEAVGERGGGGGGGRRGGGGVVVGLESRTSKSVGRPGLGKNSSLSGEAGRGATAAAASAM